VEDGAVALREGASTFFDFGGLGAGIALVTVDVQPSKSPILK
jgi:hypothetical protein